MVPHRRLEGCRPLNPPHLGGLGGSGWQSPKNEAGGLGGGSTPGEEGFKEGRPSGGGWAAVAPPQFACLLLGRGPSCCLFEAMATGQSLGRP